MKRNLTTEKILLGFDPEIENLLPALEKISEAFEYVSITDAEKVADYFTLPLSKIYETASFYDQIKVKKQPGILIQVCSSTSCAINNSMKIIKEIENFFRIKIGDEFNPKVRLETISCQGRCSEGPIVIVNGKVFERVTVSGVHEILERYIK